FLDEADCVDRLGRPVLAEFEVRLRQGFDASASAVGGDNVDEELGWHGVAWRARARLTCLRAPLRLTEERRGNRPRDCGLHCTGMRQQRQDGKGSEQADSASQPKAHELLGSAAGLSACASAFFAGRDFYDVFAWREAIELNLDLRLRPGRLRGRYDKIS